MNMLDNNFKSLVVGEDYVVPTLNSEKVRYINFDNAASTPPFKSVVNKVNEFARLYSSVHRGNGYKSQLSTEIYEESRKIVGNFVGANLNDNSIIYVKNSTEAINKLANCIQFEDGDIVICSRMEHHSNDLPWRHKAVVKYIDVKENGELDVNHYKKLLYLYEGKVKLVVITGASNVTGFINPIYDMAAMAHMVNAKIFVDGSQLIPHRKFEMSNYNENKHIDFLAFTAHKMYAPFGIGVLIGPKDFFNKVEPDTFGGGIVRMVTDNEAYWEVTPEKNEAGTPNIVGAVALATAIRTYESIGIDEFENHENMLTNYLLGKMREIEGIKIYGYPGADKEKRVGVVAFSMEGVNHALLASILAYEYGIGIRNGCFCSHPYVLRLLGVRESDVNIYRKEVLSGDKSNLPGLARVSLGIYNTCEDVDRLILALNNISKGKHSNYYIKDIKDGNYIPINWSYNLESVFQFL